MIKIYGYSVSNYFNQVEFALLEKGIDFESIDTQPSQDGEFKTKSPMGKVPCVDIDGQFLSEASVIIEYLDATHDGIALFPREAFRAARVRQVMKCLELYIELSCRRLYGEVFFGGPRDEAAFEQVKPVMESGLSALRHLCTFDEYLCGSFSAADIVAAHTFIYAAPVCQAIYDWDIVAEVPDLGGALDLINQRPAGAEIANKQAIALKKAFSA